MPTVELYERKRTVEKCLYFTEYYHEYRSAKTYVRRRFYPAHMPLQYQDLLTDLLQYNTTLQIGRRDRKVSELDMKIARAALFPKLVSMPDITTTAPNLRPRSLPSTVRTVRIGVFPMSVDIFNRLENRRKIRNAKLDMENAALSYQEAEQQVKADLAQLYNTYENNLQIVRLRKKANGCFR